MRCTMTTITIWSTIPSIDAGVGGRCMQFLKSFLQLLVVAFSLAAVVFGVLIAGYFGVLGSDLEARMSALWAELSNYQALIAKAFAIIGAIGSFLVGAFGLYRTWHYAEMNLPMRLQEFSARWQEAVLSSRSESIPWLRETETIRTPVPEQTTRLSRSLRWFYDRERRLLARLEAAIARQEVDLLVLTSGAARCRSEVLTSYLALSSRLTQTPHRKSQASESLRRALAIDSNDLDALELAGKQAFALQMDRAEQCFAKLAEAAGNLGDKIRNSRAKRFQAETLLRQGHERDLGSARTILGSNIRFLREPDWCEPILKRRELALSHELLAEVQLMRERFTAAQTNANTAESLYERIPAPWGPEGLDRVAELAQQIRQASLEPDDPNAQD